MLHLPVSVFLIYNEKAIHSQLHAYLMVTLNHGVKMLARGRKRGKTCFFPSPLFRLLLIVGENKSDKKGCGDFCCPNLKFPCLQPALRWELCTAILFVVIQ